MEAARHHHPSAVAMVSPLVVTVDIRIMAVVAAPALVVAVCMLTAPVILGALVARWLVALAVHHNIQGMEALVAAVDPTTAVVVAAATLVALAARIMLAEAVLDRTMQDSIPSAVQIPMVALDTSLSLNECDDVKTSCRIKER